MTKEIQKTEKSPQEVALKKVASRFPSLRADPSLKFAQEVQFFMTHVRNSKDLPRCTLESVQDAFMQAASLGLSWNPSLSHVYAIPRRARKFDKGNESWAEYEKSVPLLATVHPGYRGLLARADGSGGILWSHADVVHKRDVFVYRGTSREPLHKFDVMKSRGNIVGAYVFVKTPDGAYLTEWMATDQIEAARKKSEAQNSLMWAHFYEEGCKKVVIRRAVKRWPRKVQEVLLPLVEQLNKVDGIVIDDVEAEQVINDDQVRELHAKLTDSGKSSEDADRWLRRLATTFDATSIDNLPIARFEEAKAKLVNILKEVRSDNI